MKIPESKRIKDPRDAVCPCWQKSRMITLLAIFQELCISGGRWCVSFFNLKLGEIPFFVWPNCSWTTPYFPSFSIYEEWSKMQRQMAGQLNDISQLSKIRSLFPGKELSPCWKCPTQKECSLLHPFDVSGMQSSSALMTVIWSGRFHL